MSGKSSALFSRDLLLDSVWGEGGWEGAGGGVSPAGTSFSLKFYYIL